MADNHNFESEEARTAYETAIGCWNATAAFRRDRRRNMRYTFGDQWTDRITVDGREMTEEEHILREGNIPLKNNLIRRIVRSVVGVARERIASRLDARDETGKMRDRLNRMQELYGRTMEEFLISGMAIHRKRVARRDGIQGIWTDIVSPGSVFFDPMARDPRGSDLSVIGQFHELSPSVLCAAFGRDERSHRLLRQRYGGSRRVQIVEIWQREHRERRLTHDAANARILKIDDALWRVDPRLRSLPSRWILDDVWRYTFLTSCGEILIQGDSPYPGGGHPYVVKAYPFLDGEIHSFVSDIIDQQRYTNRLITLFDWVMRASAKGVLLFPEEAIPKWSDLDSIADQWGRYNGVIAYSPKAGQPMPQQVSGSNSGLGIGELLGIQLKMMEDVSGVNGALQGKLDSQATSGTLYTRQTENSLTSLRDIIDSFEAFVDDAFRLEDRWTVESDGITREDGSR